jgi:glycosyltransferase involved in cell wall biosynthesis
VSGWRFSGLRICFLIRSLDRGGTEGQLMVLANGLATRGHSVSVVTLYGGGALATEFERAGIPVRAIGKQHRWDAVALLRRLLPVIREHRADVVHGYLDAGNILAALVKPLAGGARIVWGVRTSHMDYDRYGWFPRFTATAQIALARFADLVIANSLAGREHAVRAGFPAAKLRVIPNGIDTDHFRPDADAGRALRARWGIAPDDALIGLVARLDPMKGHGTFLGAAAILAQRIPHARFVCVGGGTPEVNARLRRIAEELGIGDRVLWTGERTDVVAAYNALDVHVCASDGEGFPNVIAEAMACGTACVSTDAGDAGAILADTGIVVRPADPDALASAIETMLPRAANDDEHIRRRKRIVDSFAVPRLVEATEEALSRLLASR